jgi:lipid-binding SYLF domain-containing protein
MRLKLTSHSLALLLLLTPFAGAHADSYDKATKGFRNAGESARFFNNCYGYAIFPNVGKAGFVIGGSYGEGKVYYCSSGAHVGDAKVYKGNIGWQLGGQVFSQILFFEDQRAFDEFTNGNFEFSADASAVAITAGASASASTGGSSAGISGGQNDAKTVGDYYKGVATFTVAKGGLMYEAAIGGQKYKFYPK